MSHESSQTARHTVKVVTVTLNPALERTIVTHFLALGYHNSAIETTRLDAAGRGVNVSHALHQLDILTHAIVLVGSDPTGHAYQSVLAEETFPVSVLTRSGRTRSSIVIMDTGHDTQTVLVEESGAVTQHALWVVASRIQETLKPGDWLVFAGSIPSGARLDTYAWLTNMAQTTGVRVAINAGGGEALLASLQARPNLIYLTRTQMEGIFNIPVRAYEDVIYCGQELRKRGATRVLVSVDRPRSVFLIAPEGAWGAEMQESEGTRSGEAESMIAGYLAGVLDERPFDRALEYGAAATAFAMSRVGNEFGTRDDLNAYIGSITVMPADELAGLARSPDG
ncbi:MAG: hypothetical protein JW966_12995 [Anaerolineae bacterium]|nr:hypothetical protein [Anaerolineae bacterium]